MKTTYTMSCDFEIIIKGKYSVGNMWEDEIESPLSEDDVWTYVGENIADFYKDAQIKISNRKTEKENQKKEPCALFL